MENDKYYTIKNPISDHPKCKDLVQGSYFFELFKFALLNHLSLCYIVLALTSAGANLTDIALNFHDFLELTIKFHDFPGLENKILKFHDFPGFP